MSRKVILPKELDGRLDNLTRLTEEVNGILLYRQQEDFCPIETLFMTGVGNIGNVQAQPERMEVANEFFQRNPDYKFIKFHTHSKATIQRYGSYYTCHFSQGDIDGIQEQLRYNRDFMAMLITPSTKLLSGIDNPELLIVDNFPRYQNRNKALDQSLKIIADNLGYDLSRFQATRR